MNMAFINVISIFLSQGFVRKYTSHLVRLTISISVSTLFFTSSTKQNYVLRNQKHMPKFHIVVIFYMHLLQSVV